MRARVKKKMKKIRNIRIKIDVFFGLALDFRFLLTHYNIRIVICWVRLHIIQTSNFFVHSLKTWITFDEWKVSGNVYVPSSILNCSHSKMREDEKLFFHHLAEVYQEIFMRAFVFNRFLRNVGGMLVTAENRFEYGTFNISDV